MNKLRVIDLLNKIANGEELPKKIQLDNILFIFQDGEYISNNGDGSCLDQFMCFYYKDLNKEIEIIEEDKNIEKLDIRNEKNCKNNWKWKVYGEEHSYNISTPQKIIADKINEIIDYLEENK